MGMKDTTEDNTHWVISGPELLALLQRVERGEIADDVYLELFANAPDYGELDLVGEGSAQLLQHPKGDGGHDEGTDCQQGGDEDGGVHGPWTDDL